ncbi:MAG: MFS transporter [Prochlorococcaceae cyanobacterium]|jgi:MHS family proline/betaine transporter-like MFS transporter
MDLTPRQRRAAALAALLGNALEWYDFAVYGYVATPLGEVFFPADQPALQTMASFGVFAVGYLMRPVGSLVLGPLGDLLGRRLMLSLSIMIMGVSSLGIALLPTPAQIGVSAAVLLVLLRMVQGFSVGGEFTGSITYATEAAGRGQAGFLSSLAVAGGLAGFSLGSLSAALIGWSVGESAMNAWGWRLPFLLGAVVALAGFWMRRSLPETLPPDANGPSLRSPAELGSAMAWRLRQILRHWRLVVLVIGLVSYANVVFYLAFVYLVDHTGQQLGNSAAANTVSTVLQTLGLPLVLLGGHLADRWGLVRANRWGNLALVMVAPAALLIGLQGTVASLTVALALLLLPLMATMGAQGVLGVALVPQRERCAVFSIAYSLAMALFAGTAPLVASWLHAHRGAGWATILYTALYGILALWAVQRSQRLLAVRPR